MFQLVHDLNAIQALIGLSVDYNECEDNPISDKTWDQLSMGSHQSHHTLPPGMSGCVQLHALHSNGLSIGCQQEFQSLLESRLLACGE